MIDLSTEQTISLSQASRVLPPGRGNSPVSLSCMLRWVLQGARGPSGERVQLEALRIGGRWITSREALQRFAEALTPRQETAHTATPRSPASRRRANETAARELDQIGI